MVCRLLDLHERYHPVRFRALVTALQRGDV